jgi:hypothetical protein
MPLFPMTGRLWNECPSDAMATINLTTFGGKTCTLARAAITPVNEGKIAPPPWATTNIIPMEIVLA